MQGIPIDELIVWNERLRRMENAPAENTPVRVAPPVVKPSLDPDEFALIRGMEHDFALQAESLLESLNLKHLRAIPHK